eukprot:TRINITY_DN2930_c0_g2_i1.p1 TRINITY_DN2930_c0_g2~~TRINITY_DN2930_c0_g2_i1.p1  ORF type:complete len:547 (-),score=31.69 TRINITY_DN2930_c0_g2_i1:735-2237(-)
MDEFYDSEYSYSDIEEDYFEEKDGQSFEDNEQLEAHNSQEEEGLLSSGSFPDDDQDFGIVQSSKKYKVLDLEMVDQSRLQAIQELNSVLNIGEDVAVRVMRRFKWDVNVANESWFQDEEKYRKELGILPEHYKVHSCEQSRCLVCFEECADMKHAGCGHGMCADCWAGYVTAALNSGPQCVDLRCFQKDCLVAVSRELMLSVCDDAQRQRLKQYDRQSYVDENPRLSWCVRAGCDRVIHYSSSSTFNVSAIDVSCSCGEQFCFQCKSEAHRPVNCHTVVEWLKKAGAESENLNYIIANTKPCPQCKRAIEKNQGCNHMVCSQCRYQFCWLCLGDWKSHGEGTGGYYSCNKYENAKRKGEYDEEEAKRQHARQSLVRYTHYFERYSAHDKGMKTAQESVHKYRNQDGIEELSEKLKMEANEVKFLLESWIQVVNCRRVLKWTYAFGYYRFADDENTKKKHVRFFCKLQHNLRIFRVFIRRSRMQLRAITFCTRARFLKPLT